MPIQNMFQSLPPPLETIRQQPEMQTPSWLGQMAPGGADTQIAKVDRPINN